MVPSSVLMCLFHVSEVIQNVEVKKLVPEKICTFFQYRPKKSLFTIHGKENNATLTTLVESNAVLKVKFQKLHSTIVDNVKAAEVIDFLFQEGILSGQDMNRLQQHSEPKQQCRDLLALLHTSDNPQAFVQLYLAIMDDPQLQGLVDCIDDFTEPSVVKAPQEQRFGSEQTGNIAYY